MHPLGLSVEILAISYISIGCSNLALFSLQDQMNIAKPQRQLLSIFLVLFSLATSM